MGFEGADSAPNDLVVAIRGDEAGIAAGQAALEAALTQSRSAASGSTGFGEAPAARTLGGAIRRSGADLALVSVPGEHAVAEALDAVRAGISVMVFSDNVPVEDEVRLKDAAAAADVLVMGPDCGTAVVGGVALGFANVVRPGSVGLVAASGTGRSRSCACSTRPGWASATASGSAAATCRPPSPPWSRRSRRSPPLRPTRRRADRRRLQAAGARGARRPGGVCRQAGQAHPLGHARGRPSRPHGRGRVRAGGDRPRGARTLALVEPGISDDESSEAIRRRGPLRCRVLAACLLRRHPRRRGDARRRRGAR